MRSFYTLFLCVLGHTIFAQQQTLTLLFDINKGEPTSLSQKELLTFLHRLKGDTISAITITAHTDKKGNADYNLDLSKHRAATLAIQLKQFFPNAVINMNYWGKKQLLTQEDQEQYRNRRVELVFDYKQAENKEVIQLKPVVIDANEQRFNVDLDDTVVITGKEGTIFKIAPGTFESPVHQLLTGSATILLKEYYRPETIIMAGLHSQSDQGLLQTGGMFRFYVVKAGDTALAETKKRVEVRMPKLREKLTGMNVYSFSHSADSAQWRNTQNLFRESKPYWKWPQNMQLQAIEATVSDIQFANWRTGFRYRDERDESGIYIGFGPYEKHLSFVITKIDSLTLSVQASIKYRRKGYKAFGVWKLDTTFYVTYQRPEYYSVLENMRFINCDRFLEEKNTINYYVTTPGFEGMQVMAYFKELNAFLPATMKGKKLVLFKVPAGQKVYLVAYGVKGNDYYYGEKSCILEKNGTESLQLTKLEKELFLKKFGAIE